MRSGTLPGLARPLSRIVLGTAQVTLSGADLPASAWFRLWDDALEAGITAFDAGFHYGARSESLLGRWLASRGARDDVVLLHKVAHTPACTPEAVGSQLAESLERLGTDRVDVLVLHRDDERIPVGEFVDALDDEARGGRAAAVGVSNWSTRRAEGFGRHAVDHGRQDLSLVSNQLSLADMARPVWDGSLQADTAWHEARQVPLLAWSAQARGFFAGRPDGDEEVERCWLTPDNVERRRRARALAARIGTPVAAVALAWVLARPFPTFAVVGSVTSAQLAPALAAGELSVGAGEISALTAGTG